MSRFIYNNEMLSWVKANQADISRSELTRLFNAKFGTSSTRNGLISLCARNCWRSSKNTGQIKKGGTPWNKGATGYMGSNQTSYKGGEQHFRYRPVGSERHRIKSGKRTIIIKFAEPNDWRAKHLVVWELVNGKLPSNHCIKFLDNDHTNCDIDNLVCVNRSVHGALKKNPANTDDPNLNHAIILSEQLKYAVNNIDKVRNKDE